MKKESNIVKEKAMIKLKEVKAKSEKWFQIDCI